MRTWTLASIYGVLCFTAICFADEPGQKDAPQESATSVADPKIIAKDALEHIRRATEKLEQLRAMHEAADSSGKPASSKLQDFTSLQELKQQIEELGKQAAWLQYLKSEQIHIRFRILELNGKSAAEWKTLSADPKHRIPSATSVITEVDELLTRLKAVGDVKTVAEPHLITTLGRPANLLAGGEFPILIPVEDNTTKIEWREFGVRCQAVPIPADEPGKVKLNFQTEISERDFKKAVQVRGITIPGLNTRRVNTEATMSFGETLVVSVLPGLNDRHDDEYSPDSAAPKDASAKDPSANDASTEEVTTLFLVTMTRE